MTEQTDVPMTKDPDSPSFQRVNAMVDSPAIKPMPPDFQLKHPRRVRWSGRFEQPNGDMPHFCGSSDATPEQEAWHRIHDPERGLHPDDLSAYRKSQRGPVARFFARLKFWPSKVKDEGEFELPAYLRNQAD
jgi:hypothetical protein